VDSLAILKTPFSYELRSPGDQCDRMLIPVARVDISEGLGFRREIDTSPFKICPLDEKTLLSTCAALLCC
jgi:hypothetical protein